MDLVTHQPAGLSGASLLSYRPWRGRLGGPWRGTLAVARLGLAGLVRRKLVWILFAFAMLIFFSFFFGQYLLVWIVAQMSEDQVRLGGFIRLRPEDLRKLLDDSLKLNGSAATFRNLFWYEGMILNVSLALVGAQLVGNDFRHRSLPFYLAKPLSARHYVIGKCLAVATIISVMTTLPALALYVEYGLLDSWGYFWDAGGLALGILGYGAILAVVLSLLLVAVTSWVQKTVPLVMVWSALFVMAPTMGAQVASWTRNPRWRLMDVWNNCYVVGNHLLGETLDRQPTPAAAATVLVLVCCACVAMLYRRVNAVEIV